MRNLIIALFIAPLLFSSISDAKPKAKPTKSHGCQAEFPGDARFVLTQFNDEWPVQGMPSPAVFFVYSDPIYTTEAQRNAKKMEIRVSIQTPISISSSEAVFLAGQYLRRLISEEGMNLKLVSLRPCTGSGNVHVLAGWFKKITNGGADD